MKFSRAESQPRVKVDVASPFPTPSSACFDEKAAAAVVARRLVARRPRTVLVTPYIEFPRQISASGDLEKCEDL